MLSPETIDRALREIAKGYAQYQYFFEHLNSPAWLEPLSQRGFFRKPPEPVREGEYISFLQWPESRYLARIARVQAAQNKVLEIALRIPNTENSRVHDDLLDVALALSPERSAKLLPQARVWAQSPNKLLLPYKIGELIVHLAEGGQGESALTLAQAVLALGPDPRATAENGEEPLRWPEPRRQFDDFHFDRIVDASLAPLVRSTGLGAVRLFCGLLDDFINLSRKRSDAGEEDFLYHHQAAIEDPKNPHDLASSLICAVRDSAEKVIAEEHSQFPAVIAILRDKNWSTFRRLELHLAGMFPEDGRTFAKDFFEDPAKLDSSLRHEAVLLLKSCFSALEADTQGRILRWMDEGPPPDSMRRWLEFIQQPVTEDNIRSLADEWRRDHLATLEGQLPADYQQKLTELRTAMGQGRRLEEPNKITGGAFGPKSPKSAAELSRMNVDEILSFLRSWAPGQDVFSLTAEGLGRELSAIVIQRLDEFAALAHRFQELDPTYVRFFFTAFTSAIKQDKAQQKIEADPIVERHERIYPWQPALELAEWITNRPREIPGRKGSLFITDPDWGWTRDAIIDLLTEGFDANRGTLHYEFRELVWRVLLPLTNDPIPSLADETREHFDPADLSINSTRGRAFYAVVRYGWWVRESTEQERKDTKRAPACFDEMPEIREVLEAHLNIATDPTLTIRAVYGQSLPSLAAFGWEWFNENLHRILPAEDENRFTAAWESFVTFDQPNTALLTALLPSYQRAVNRIGKPGLLHQPISPEVRLAQHLMVYYWVGRLDFGTEDGLINGFFRVASDDLRGHAIWFVGASVTNWGDEAPAEAYERLRKLIERRLEAATSKGSPYTFVKELSNFGYWFVSGKFEERWALMILLNILMLTKKSESEMAVVKRLAEICPRYPAECVSCLRLMVEGDRDRWLVIGVEGDAQELLRLALLSNHPDAALSARRLIEELIAKGHFQFRRLLQ
jgi:hypothetical protein